ncbi:MAG TPA: hypothetical protein VMF11_06600 [Candidatus Baltobacteraceae bacterium]|nr:hypothetical protein [Candidatus Baltobacteraceae bacterium]
MRFHSILFPSARDEPDGIPEAPSFFTDLNLDQIIDAIVSAKEAYGLKPFFYTHLKTIEAIRYRHAVMRDVEKTRIYALIAEFAATMDAVRQWLALAKKSSYTYERARWRVDAADLYCEAARRLVEGLGDSDVESDGLIALRDHLLAYLEADGFRALSRDAASLLTDLAQIDYQVLVGSGTVTVRNGNHEGDLVTSVQATFERFRQGATKSYLLKFAQRTSMNHIEAKVLDFVALLHPDVFSQLERFGETYESFIDESIARFEREIQFYVACTDYHRAFERAGLPTCYPLVDANGKEVRAEDVFDLALAQRLVASDARVVRNDFSLSGPERVFVVSGPNQGGKTTFARTFGQIHYLAALGCRVAGRRAATFLFDAIFTHFEREEDPSALRGKLEDDVIRIHEILERATPNSIIILNEIFASTTAYDASTLARRIMSKILELDTLGVCVTFIDELASLSEKTVSIVSLVNPENPDVRTYKLARRPADGLAYAVSLAEKYGLTYDRLHRRLTIVERP